MIPLTDEENEVYERQEVFHICRGEFCTDENKKINSEITVITQENLEELCITIVI